MLRKAGTAAISPFPRSIQTSRQDFPTFLELRGSDCDMSISLSSFTNQTDFEYLNHESKPLKTGECCTMKVGLVVLLN